MRMTRYVFVGLAALAVGAALHTGAGHVASPLPADLRIAQTESPGTASDSDQPAGPYVLQHLDNHEGGGVG